jgi:hypothetical protein
LLIYYECLFILPKFNLVYFMQFWIFLIQHKSMFPLQFYSFILPQLSKCCYVYIMQKRFLFIK